MSALNQDSTVPSDALAAYDFSPYLINDDFSGAATKAVLLLKSVVRDDINQTSTKLAHLWSIEISRNSLKIGRSVNGRGRWLHVDGDLWATAACNTGDGYRSYGGRFSGNVFYVELGTYTHEEDGLPGSHLRATGILPIIDNRPNSKIARNIFAAVVRILPHEHRARYMAEFLGEALSLDKLGQISYALSLGAAVLHMRRALKQAAKGSDKAR